MDLAVEEREVRNSDLVCAGSFVLPFVVLAVPYIWYLHAHGQWLISGKIAFVWQQASVVNFIYFDQRPERDRLVVTGSFDEHAAIGLDKS